MTTGPYRTKLGERSVDFLDFMFTWFGRAWVGFWGVFMKPGFWAAVALAAVFTLAFKMATSDGKIEYCYVDRGATTGRFMLYGYRSWRLSVELAMAKPDNDPAPLYGLAKQIECPIR